MNLKTEYMISKSFITVCILCILPTFAVFGQQLKKEMLKGTNSANPGSNYAVFYSTGMPESAIWPLGMKLSKNRSTIRHTSLKAIGDNMNVNDKVPFRFIIAPEEGTQVTWAAAMGFNTAANNNLNPDGVTATTGCASFSTTEFPDGWRLPTQREMMLMWLLQAGINAVYPTTHLSGRYWSATENDATKAWYLDFNSTAPESNVYGKSTSYKYRCVRDY